MQHPEHNSLSDLAPGLLSQAPASEIDASAEWGYEAALPYLTAGAQQEGSFDHDGGPWQRSLLG